MLLWMQAVLEGSCYECCSSSCRGRQLSGRLRWTLMALAEKSWKMMLSDAERKQPVIALASAHPFYAQKFSGMIYTFLGLSWSVWDFFFLVWVDFCIALASVFLCRSVCPSKASFCLSRVKHIRKKKITCSQFPIPPSLFFFFFLLSLL